jgi:hypothetical protein
MNKKIFFLFLTIFVPIVVVTKGQTQVNEWRKIYAINDLQVSYLELMASFVASLMLEPNPSEKAFSNQLKEVQTNYPQLPNHFSNALIKMFETVATQSFDQSTGAINSSLWKQKLMEYYRPLYGQLKNKTLLIGPYKGTLLPKPN